MWKNHQNNGGYGGRSPPPRKKNYYPQIKYGQRVRQKWSLRRGVFVEVFWKCPLWRGGVIELKPPPCEGKPPLSITEPDDHKNGSKWLIFGYFQDFSYSETFLQTSWWSILLNLYNFSFYAWDWRYLRFFSLSDLAETLPKSNVLQHYCMIHNMP